MKGYYHSLVTTLSTAKPSVRWTLVFMSQIPLFLMVFYAWELITKQSHTVGALMLLKHLIHAGELSQQAQEAALMAFAPSKSGIVMLAALFVSVVLGFIFLFIAVVQARRMAHLSVSE